MDIDEGIINNTIVPDSINLKSGKSSSSIKKDMKNSRLGMVNLKEYIEEIKPKKSGTSLAGISKQQRAAIKKHNEKVVSNNDDPFAGDFITNE